MSRQLLTLVAVSLLAAMFHSNLSAEPPKPATVGAGDLDPAAVKPGVWYKRTPIEGAPRNPQMGYEGAWAWDPYDRVILRWGGHNQGGGGEQNSEMWAYDPVKNTFTLREPNYFPPGSCCNREQVFDLANRRYVRFPSFSASHGWQWRRMVYQMQSSVWTYDYPSNQWRNMRPWPEVTPGPMRGAAYMPDDQVTLVCQGQGVEWGSAIYDLYTNTWHRLNAKNEPPGRNTFGIAYDPVGRKFVTFGSQNGSDPRTWIYDIDKNEWQGLELKPHPPAVRNGAVMAYDPLHKMMLCVAIAQKGGGDDDEASGALETWAFDPAKLAWRKLDVVNPPDPSGVRARLMLFAPELNAFVLEIRTEKPKEQQEWLFRYADYTPPADSVDIFRGMAPTAVTSGKSVTLKWADHTAGPTTCNVYRGTGEKPWAVKYAKVATVQTAAANMTAHGVYEDKDVKPGTIYYYYVVPLGKDGKEGSPSLKVRAQPKAIVDVVVSAVDAKKVELSWDKQADDVAGYNVYRAPLTIYSNEQYGPIRDKNKLAKGPADPQVGVWRFAGEFTKINDKPLADPAFTDTSIDLSKPAPTPQGRYADENRSAYKFAVYAYRVTAVNKLGVESGPSPYYLTIPEPVSDLKSRESKGGTDLRWSAGKEKNIVGYRIYRMEGRYDKDGVTLITPEPVKGTTYTDNIPNGPDDPAKRYYVVAVDSLGQEGIVGSPTWGAREYARYYEGFLGEWHQ